MAKQAEYLTNYCFFIPTTGCDTIYHNLPATSSITKPTILFTKSTVQSLNQLIGH